MGSDINDRLFLPNLNGHQSPYLASPLNAGASEFEEDKLDVRNLLDIGRRRALLIAGVAIAVGSGMAVKTVSQAPNYANKFQLLVEPVSGEKELNPLSQSLGKAAGFQTPWRDYGTQIQVLSSPQVLDPIVEQIQERYPDLDYNTLGSKLAISQLQQTKILEVSYQDSDPEKVKFVLEALAQGYLDYSQQEQQTTTRQGINFVDEQLPKLQERVNKLQEQLQRFRQKYNITNPETQGQLLTNRVSAIVQNRQETQASLRESQALYNQLKGQLGLSQEEAIKAASLSEAPRYQRLLNEFSELEAKIATESARFTPESPMMETLLEQRQNLVPLLRQEAAKAVGPNSSSVPDNAESLASSSSIHLDLAQQMIGANNQIQVLEVRAKAIAQAENTMKGQLQQLAVIAREYTDLQRELTVATESLNRFLAVKETLEIESVQKALPWQMIREPQQPGAPISPNIPRGLILSTVAGLLAGAGAGLLAEKLDRVFHSPEELKDGTGLSLLGTIPFRKELKAAHLQASKPRGKYRYVASAFSEAFRSLHANLDFINPDQPVRSIAISSSIPSEGKSTITTCLAQAAAAMGQKVLLVDADLRRPQVHARLDLPNVWGLSNVISSDINVDDVIQRSPTDENLFVLTAGEIPPDPTRLLGSQKMRNLAKQLQESFDLVIFDTPPLLGLTDARLLTPHTDGLVMVVGLGKTDRSVLKEVLYGLRTSHTKVLGVVANGVKGYTPSSYHHLEKYYQQHQLQENQEQTGQLG
ncbi:MAG: polysaccharide biosynthesis tyrosine autokinase [Coleofasciculaceae cyanobacterium]